MNRQKREILIKLEALSVKFLHFFGGCCFFLKSLASLRSRGSWSYTYSRTSSGLAVARVKREVLAARGRPDGPGDASVCTLGELAAGDRGRVSSSLSLVGSDSGV